MSRVRDRLGPEGALVMMSVAVHPVRRSALVRGGFAVPQAKLIKAQLDTGSHRSGVHPGVFAGLGLDGEVDMESVRTVSTGEEPHPMPIYLCDLIFHTADGTRTFANVRVLANVFGDDEEARAIIGRDVLNGCHLEWDGPGGWFTIVF